MKKRQGSHILCNDDDSRAAAGGGGANVMKGGPACHVPGHDRMRQDRPTSSGQEQQQPQNGELNTTLFTVKAKTPLFT